MSMIGGDLNQPGKDYRELIAKIKTFGASFRIAPVAIRGAVRPLLLRPL